MGSRNLILSVVVCFVCGAASANLGAVRGGPAEQAVMSGPMELCRCNERARYVAFIALESIGEPEAALIRNGQRLGWDLDFAAPYRLIVWELDEVSTLKRSFWLWKLCLGTGWRPAVIAEPAALQLARNCAV
jgi:hypothetical protein